MALRITLILIFISTFYFGVSAQVWSSVGNGMSNIVPFFTSYVNAVGIYNSELYAGGSFSYADGVTVNNIARWNGTNWIPMDSGVNGTVNDILEYNGELYVVGNFNSVGGIPANNIAKWDGNTWSSVGLGLRTGGSPFVSALAIYNGNLYAAGNFDSAGTVAAHNIAMWDGVNWSSVNYLFGNGLTLEVFNGELYTGGQFFISKWDGSNWTSINVGNHDPVYSTVILKIMEFNGELYAGGRFDSIGNILAYSIAKWNGVDWLPLGNGTDNVSQNDIVSSIASYNNKIYIGGYFSSAGGNTVNNIAKWDGVNWTPLGTGVNDGVSSLKAINNDLFVGGSFTMAGNISANRIAKWNLPIGIEELIYENPVKVFPNPFNENLNISAEGCESCNILLYDLTSRFIIQKQLANSSVINTEYIEEGIYIYEIQDESGIIGKGKLIKN